MKSFKTLLASVAILTCATAVQAQTVVRITGSTAFRTAMNNGIKNIFDAGVTIGHTGSSFTGSSQVIFKGNIGGNPVIVKTSMGGSVGGIYTTSEGVAINYQPDTAVDGFTPGTTTGSLASGAASELPDATMSDTFQASTLFNTNVLQGGPVGIVPFQWVVSRGLASTSFNLNTTSGSNIALIVGNVATGITAGSSIKGNSNIPNGTVVGTVTVVGSDTQITLVASQSGAAVNATATASGTATDFAAAAPIDNITPQLAQVLYQAGSVSLATFTGNPADNTKLVFGLGRDPDSGTRLTAFAESGIGTNSVVKQWQPTTAGGAVTSQILYPGATFFGSVVYANGDNGYGSGGTLAGVMGNTTSAISGHYIAYAGTSDATAAVNAGAKALKWNGVAYSLQATQEGLYTFWGYEHLLYTQATNDNAAKKAVVDALANQIINVESPIKLSDMKVARNTDGGQVIQNY
ncbi:MAG: hypothetical protein KDK97_00810 [Verrucomicrobiales bacterium]|nr:hypothetical protein [Verrucomicrobiales bacterium]